MNLSKADIEFTVEQDGKEQEIKFSVIHNLPEINGLSLRDALENWMFRTKKFTAKSLCKYINNKQTGYTCMTVEEYEKIMQQ